MSFSLGIALATMRLLRTNGEELKLDIFSNERDLPEYGILSHVWLAAEEEISFQDVEKGRTSSEKQGRRKLDFARKQAHEDGFEYVWIDTCCIDKNSSAELAEAINSMYRWYKYAEVCYVYLADILDSVALKAQEPGQGDTNTWNRNSFGHSRWFKRGWTLQEMMAPEKEVRFYSSSWKRIGTLSELAGSIAEVTGIHVEALRRSSPVSSYSIAQRMSWAADRQTTKVEDQAYSLLGLFDVSLPIIYGEGERAFSRLQVELLRVYSDQTIFAWLALSPDQGEASFEREPSDLLAASPRDFKLCGQIVPIEQKYEDADRDYHWADIGVIFKLPTMDGGVDDKYYASRYRNKASYFPGRMEAALRCRYQDDPTAILVLVLAKARESINSYYVLKMKRSVVYIGQWSTASAAVYSWVQGYECPNYHITREFTILRPTYRPGIRHPRQSGEDTISCRLVEFPRRRSVESPRGGKVELFSPCTPEFVQTEPLELWRYHSDKEGSFVPAINIDNGHDQHFSGQLVIRYGSTKKPRLMTMNIAASREDDEWVCRLTFDQHPGTRLAILRYTAVSPMAVDLSGAWVIFATAERRLLVHQQVIAIKVFFGPIGLLWNLYPCCIALFWMLLSLTMLPGTIFVPVLALSSLRKQAYGDLEGDMDTMLTTSEARALEVGVPLAFVVSAYLLFSSRLYFTWRPMSWRKPMLWLLRLASMVLCGLAYTSSDFVRLAGRGDWSHTLPCRSCDLIRCQWWMVN